MGTSGRRLAENGGYLGTELSSSQMVVQHSDIDLVEQLLRFVDGARGVRQVAMLAQDGGSKEQILWIVVKEQYADGISTRCKIFLPIGQRLILPAVRLK